MNLKQFIINHQTDKTASYGVQGLGDLSGPLVKSSPIKVNQSLIDFDKRREVIRQQKVGQLAHTTTTLQQPVVKNQEQFSNYISVF